MNFRIRLGEEKSVTGPSLRRILDSLYYAMNGRGEILISFNVQGESAFSFLVVKRVECISDEEVVVWLKHVEDKTWYEVRYDVMSQTGSLYLVRREVNNLVAVGS